MVKLQSDRASLDVSGLSIEGLRSIEAQQAGQITINGLPDEGESPRGKAKRAHRDQVSPAPADENSIAAQADDRYGLADDDGDPAPPGAEVIAKTEKPLSRSAAAALVELSDDPDWPNEVWSFWARSHHLRVDDRTPVIPGTFREPFEVPATVHIEEATPAEQREAQLTAFAAAHPVYSVVECVVRSLTNTGVVVDLDNGIEGFIPLTELSWANRVRHPDQVVALGDALLGVVLEIPAPPTRPRVSAKALVPDPFAAFKGRYRPGARVIGKVDGAIDQVVFIDLGNDLDGSIHISELDHTRLRSATDFAPVGTELEVEVVGFDEAARRVNLSRKRVLPHPYEEYKHQHSVGSAVTAEVDRVSKSHVNVRLDGAAEGVIHVSKLSAMVNDATAEYRIGDTVTAKIVSFNDTKEQVELSIRALLYDEYKSRHSIGDRISCTVVSTTATHAYVALPNGALGAIYAGNLAHERPDDVSKAVDVGTELTAQITAFKDDRGQVELSVKAVLPDPYHAAKSATPLGSTVSVEVTGFNNSFAYVRLPSGAEGSIYVKEISTTYVAKPSDFLQRGQRVSGLVIGFDDQRKKVQLSLRQAPSAAARPPIVSPPAANTPPKAPLTQWAVPPAAAAPPVTRPAPRSVTVEGETVGDAIAMACRQLGVSTSAVTHQVLDPGVPKRFLRAGRPARVRVTTV